MIRIGIELSNVIRDINTQYIKYYKKDIDKTFDDEEIDSDNVIITDEIKFKSKKDEYNFRFIDYPYELFGCANPVDKNLPTLINNWLYEITNIEDEEYEIIIFGLGEQHLSIQSSFYFLSKIGARIRKVIFPKTDNEIWGECDVIITTNNNVIESKPNDKKLVLIEKKYNEHLKNEAKLIYNSLTDLINDTDFFNKIKN